MGPQIEQVIVVSISPPSDQMLSFEEEEKCIHLNAQATNVLFSALSEDVFESIMPLEDAHLIWNTLKERYDKSECDETHVFIEGNEMVSSVNVDTSTSYSACETNLLKEEVCGKKWPSEEFTSPRCSSPRSDEYSCIMEKSSLEKENLELKAQLVELTSKHVDLQEKYDELLCSHGNIVDSHAMLEVTHEVIITTVKSYVPHIQVDFTCANSYCSQANIFPSTICDLDYVEKKDKRIDHGLVGNAQPSQDNRESMVKKLEKGTTVACNKFYQEDIKSNNKIKGQDQRKNKTSITCFKCKKMGHHVRDCPWKKEKKLNKNEDLAHKFFKSTKEGHFASSCPRKIDDEITLPTKTSRINKRKCYG
ncbi:hypothetical protein OsJ_17801 [Oryza sativa Japonica Group]|nr:hypothetical protein OsJ_17801 [Oryza sativa Japonica Group]